MMFNILQYISGDDNIEEIPVPIPNTEVKLYRAENIYGLPCWENRLLPDYIFSVSSVGRALGC
jgi:hypothetical protein